MVKNAYIIPGLPSKDLELLVKMSSLPDIISVIDVICENFEVDADHIFSRKRSGNIPLARHLAIFIIREKFRIKTEPLGEMFDGRDHTSVLYSCKTVKNLWDSDKQFRYLVIKVLTT